MLNRKPLPPPILHVIRHGRLRRLAGLKQDLHLSPGTNPIVPAPRINTRVVSDDSSCCVHPILSICNQNCPVGVSTRFIQRAHLIFLLTLCFSTLCCCCCSSLPNFHDAEFFLHFFFLLYCENFHTLSFLFSAFLLFR